ncbi:MAG TPA: PhoU domain-containing protein [archaeon]|nr:PhoU domain-containing protein [archaeon]
MFKKLVQWFKGEGLLSQAKEEVLEMLKENLSMFRDSVKLLWTNEGASLDEIRERDRQINRNVRDVRKKVLTHLVFSGSSGLETSLALISIVRDIERIGDHAKDICYLATDFPGSFKPGDFKDDLQEFENAIAERLQILVEIFESGDEENKKAARLTTTHKDIDRQYRSMLLKLITEENESLSSGQSAILALYMRYLRRIEGHIFNIASAEVNPFHRIGFRAKDKEKSKKRA